MLESQRMQTYTMVSSRAVRTQSVHQVNNFKQIYWEVNIATMLCYAGQEKFLEAGQRNIYTSGILLSFPLTILTILTLYLSQPQQQMP